MLERIESSEQFWSFHNQLMAKSPPLTVGDLNQVSAELEKGKINQNIALMPSQEAAAKVEQDVASANASGFLMTPTFFIYGRRYDGPWGQHALKDALQKHLVIGLR